MKKDHPKAAKEIELLRELLADVTPIPRTNRARLATRPPAPVAEQRQRDEQAALAASLSAEDPWDSGLETGDELNFLRPGLPAITLRKLRRGHWVIQDEIDLHGLTVPQARELLALFLAASLRRGLRCVRVIHGKGLRSKNREPVLKKKVARWLMQRDEVLAYCQARRTEGGGGAVVILLQAG